MRKLIGAPWLDLLPSPAAKASEKLADERKMHAGRGVPAVMAGDTQSDAFSPRNDPHRYGGLALRSKKQRVRAIAQLPRIGRWRYIGSQRCLPSRVSFAITVAAAPSDLCHRQGAAQQRPALRVGSKREAALGKVPAHDQVARALFCPIN